MDDQVKSKKCNILPLRTDLSKNVGGTGKSRGGKMTHRHNDADVLLPSPTARTSVPDTPWRVHRYSPPMSPVSSPSSSGLHSASRRADHLSDGYTHLVPSLLSPSLNLPLSSSPTVSSPLFVPSSNRSCHSYASTAPSPLASPVHLPENMKDKSSVHTVHYIPPLSIAQSACPPVSSYTSSNAHSQSNLPPLSARPAYAPLSISSSVSSTARPSLHYRNLSSSPYSASFPPSSVSPQGGTSCTPRPAKLKQGEAQILREKPLTKTVEMMMSEYFMDNPAMREACMSLVGKPDHEGRLAEHNNVTAYETECCSYDGRENVLSITNKVNSERVKHLPRDFHAMYGGPTYNDKLIDNQYRLERTQHPAIMGCVYEYCPGIGRVQVCYVNGGDDKHAYPIVTLPKMTPYDILEWKNKQSARSFGKNKSWFSNAMSRIIPSTFAEKSTYNNYTRVQ